MGEAEVPGRRPLRRPKRPDKAPKRDREDWLEAAREALIADGVDRVKIEPLAKRLGVTTGSFYHHFSNRQELLEQLLAHWERYNSRPMYQAVESAGDDPDAQFDALFSTMNQDSAFDPDYDSAVRAWARTSDFVRTAVHRVDEGRVELLARIFRRFGYDANRAFTRARIAYFATVGYQALDISESPARRRQLRGLYREALVGTPPRDAR